MKVGINREAELKEKSKEWDIAFPHLLRGLVVEEIMYLIYRSSFCNCMWLSNSQILGLEQYRMGKETPLEFYYVEENRQLEENQFVPGQRLSWKMATYMIALIFNKDASELIAWKGRAVQNNESFEWNLVAEFKDMEIPVAVRLIPFRGQEEKPERKELSLLFHEGESLEYLHYAKESLLANNLYEIMAKLELVNSMEPFEIIDRILLEQSVSGRLIYERLELLLARDEKVRNPKRMEQLSSYMTYSYMRKRWESYAKAKNYKNRSWEEVLQRLLHFGSPIWEAICNDQVFFDDWMPELGRFLL